MLKENMNMQMMGQVKIFDKDTGNLLLKKNNAIHPGNMAYIIASALAGQATSVNPGGSTPSITWMGFGNGGSTSTTSLSYRSPRVSGVYDGTALNASSSALYSAIYYQAISPTVFYPGQEISESNVIPANTSKIVFTVGMDHNAVANSIYNTNGYITPQTDSSTGPEVGTYTFDEIALIAGVTEGGQLAEDKSLLVSHVTFHPILLSANRTVVVEYTVTMTVN